MASATVQAGNVVQINLVCRLSSQLVMNTWHYWADPTGTAGTITVSQVMTRWESVVWQPSAVGATDGLSNLMTAAVSDAKLTGQLVYGANSRSRSEVYLLDPDDGDYPDGNTLPSGNSIVMQRVGTRAGPKFQGRVYLFGGSTAMVQDSLLKPASFTQFQTWADRLNPPFVFGAGGTLVTLKPCLFERNVSPLAGATELTHLMTSPVRYQRRREVGVGQ